MTEMYQLPTRLQIIAAPLIWAKRQLLETLERDGEIRILKSERGSLDALDLLSFMQGAMLTSGLVAASSAKDMPDVDIFTITDLGRAVLAAAPQPKMN